MYFHIQPKHALIGDINTKLIDTYLAIKDNWSLVYRYLREHHNNHSVNYYYSIRSKTMRSIYSQAAQFIYLNRTCWNGLYRVNLSGNFNVPIGTKHDVIYDDDCFSCISDLLKNAIIYRSDFEELIDLSERDDFLFIDPPYTVKHNNNGFIKYNEKLFSWGDQERLYYALVRARQRGAHILATNAYHRCLTSLYRDKFDLLKTSRRSAISSKVSRRANFEELIIYSGG